MNPFDNPLQNCLLFYAIGVHVQLGPKSKLKLHQMDFLFEILDIPMNEKKTCHDCHGFKW
jgi:hypothetical protein